MRKTASYGFTLIEITMSVSILTVVSLLMFVAVRTSSESSAMNAAKEEVSANLRDAMVAITRDVRQAYTQRTVNAAPPKSPEDAFAVEVTAQGKGLRYCIPEPSPTSPRPEASTPILIRFDNEDANGNGVLDPGEDTNGDGALTRRLVRVQGGQEHVLGAANHISDVTFSLQPSSAANSNALTTLVVTINGSKAFVSGAEKRLVTSQLESRINLEN